MKMKPTIIQLTTLLSLSLAALSLSAQTLKVTLSGSQEVPAVTSNATGKANINISDDGSISGEITTTGIQGTMAHVHEAAKGQNGPVIIKLSKSGEHSWIIPTGSKLSAEQIKSFKNGHLYVNVHSDAHQSGEIRGQLQP